MKIHKENERRKGKDGAEGDKRENKRKDDGRE